MREKGFLRNQLFYCDHISESDDLYSFYIEKETGKGLEIYLKSFALKDEEANMARTYLVKSNDTDEIVGYFTLKAGSYAYNETGNLFHRRFDTGPGIELADFAVNDRYLKRHPMARGVGYIIFLDFVLKVVTNVSKEIGINILYIFALPFPKVISRYIDYGFIRLPKKQERLLHRRIKPNYDQGCIFMYMKI